MNESSQDSSRMRCRRINSTATFHRLGSVEPKIQCSSMRQDSRRG